MKTIINGTERVIKFSEFIKVKSISYLSSRFMEKIVLKRWMERRF